MVSNVDEGTFLPSYCNAEPSDGLADYSSRLDSTPQNLFRDQRGMNSIQGFQVSAQPQAEVTFEPMYSWERNIDQVGDEQQSTEGLLNGILPHVSYVGGHYIGPRIVVDDEGVKRDKGPS